MLTKVEGHVFADMCKVSVLSFVDVAVKSSKVLPWLDIENREHHVAATSCVAVTQTIVALDSSQARRD